MLFQQSHRVSVLIAKTTLSRTRSSLICHCRHSSNGPNASEKTFFGSEFVTPDEKREKVQSLFSQVAERYDLMNDIMSVFTHRLMKNYFVDNINVSLGLKHLDLAGGTGDIAFRILEARKTERLKQHRSQDNNELNAPQSGTVVLLDINDNMIEICKKRAKAAGLINEIKYVRGTAEVLPFSDNTFDVVTIAFGIRNVALMDQALSEAKRVLKVGGMFTCLEFSRVENPIANKLYGLYSHIIPCLGQIVVGDWKSYQYLVDSIQKFPSQEDFQEKLENVGFKLVKCTNVFNGIAAIHNAFKFE